MGEPVVKAVGQGAPAAGAAGQDAVQKLPAEGSALVSDGQPAPAGADAISGAAQPAVNPFEIVDAFNARKSAGTLFSLKLDLNPEKNRYVYNLHFQEAGRSEKPVELVPYTPGYEPLIMQSGILFPLAFGFAPAGIEPSRVNFREFPFGQKYQSYLYIPFDNHAGMMSAADLIQSDFERSLLKGQEKDFHIRSIDSKAAAVPVYEIFTTIPYKFAPLDLHAGGKEAGGEVFRKKDKPEKAKTKPVEFKLGDIDFKSIPDSVRVCLAIDHSGSVSKTFEGGWQLISGLREKIPDGFKSKLWLSAVSAVDGRVIYPLRPMNDEYFNEFSRALGNLKFRGGDEALKIGAAVCNMLVEPEKSSEDVPRKTILVTDPEGLEEKAGGEKADFGEGVEVIKSPEDLVHESFDPNAKKETKKILAETWTPVLKHYGRAESLRKAAAGIIQMQSGDAIKAIDEGLADLDRPDGGSEDVAIIAVGMLANYKQLGWDDATLAHFVSKLKGIILGNTDYPLKSMAVQVLGRYATDRLDGAIDALVAISESTAVKDKRVQVEIQALLEQLDIYARSRAIFEGARLDPMTVSPDTIAELGLNVYTAASLLLIAEYGTPLSANRALEKLREVSARLDDAEKAEYAGRILPFLSELKEIGGYDNALLDGLSALFAAGGGGEKESADVFDESSWAKAPRLSIEASDEHYAVEGLTEGEGAAQIKEFVGKTAQKHSWVMLERSDGRTGWYHLGGNDAAVIFGPDPERARKIKRIVFYHLDAGAELLPTLVQRLSSDSLAAVLERPYNAAKRGFSGTVEEVILSPHGRIWYKKKGGNAPAAFVREDAKKITTRLSQVRDKADADLLGLFDGVLEIRYER